MCRCTWDPAIPSHLAFPPLITPSFHPPSPPDCLSSWLSQLVPIWLPNFSGRSAYLVIILPCRNDGLVPLSLTVSLLSFPLQPYSVPPPLSSQLSGMACPHGWSGRLPYVRCILGPEFSAADGRKIKMAVYNTMNSILLNNIFASIEGKVEPGKCVWLLLHTFL